MTTLHKQGRMKFLETLCETMRQLVLQHEMKIRNLHERLEKLEPKKEEPCQSNDESVTKP